MVFSGLSFLYYFLPCVLCIYFAAPSKGQNLVLLAASLIFYAWGEPKYVLLMLFFIVGGYGVGILLEKRRKGVLAFAITGFAGIFLIFKCSDSLPVGISFYTFQIISYLVDVYRGEVPAQKKLLPFALYVSMFPQLIAGPIVRYQDVMKQMENRRTTWQGAEMGIRRFIIGLSKKVLLANELGELCRIFRASDEKSLLYYWLYAVAFCLHIYFDFSGYSDMAIGLGRLFGFSFPENFNYPYTAKSITEFWRRWHMSLGTWFRDYVYIPLGGSRTPGWKQYRNILLVWMLTGFWHGAAWNFVLWGLYFGLLLIFEKKWILPERGGMWRGGDKVWREAHGRWRGRLGMWREVLGHVYVMLLVIVGFVIFQAEDLSQAAEDIRGMFGMGGVPVYSAEAGYYLRSYGMTLLAAAVGSTPWPVRVVEGSAVWAFVKSAVLLALLFLSTAHLAEGSFQPFLYFQF